MSDKSEFLVFLPGQRSAYRIAADRIQHAGDEIQLFVDAGQRLVGSVSAFGLAVEAEALVSAPALPKPPLPLPPPMETEGERRRRLMPYGFDIVRMIGMCLFGAVLAAVLIGR